MKFHKKNILMPGAEGKSFKCHDYSSITDIDLYKGGYGDYYCNIYYTTPGDIDYDENKNVTLICLSEAEFIDNSRNYTNSNLWEKEKTPIVIDDKFKFFKSVIIKHSNSAYRYFFFIHEELSVSENREVKIDSIVVEP